MFLKSARAAGRGAKNWRNPPVQPRFGGQNLRVFLKRPGGSNRVAALENLREGVLAADICDPTLTRHARHYGAMALL